jgi:uncharacterized protein
MTGFVFRLIAPRPDFSLTMSEDERAVMTAHVSYWSSLAAAGTVLAFGPVIDPREPYGIGIIVAPDLAAAEVIRDSDPAVRSGHGFRTEIAPMAVLVTPTETHLA